MNISLVLEVLVSIITNGQLNEYHQVRLKTGHNLPFPGFIRISGKQNLPFQSGNLYYRERPEAMKANIS